MKKIKFEKASTQRVYENYLSQIKIALKSIDKDDRDDILMEFNSHIYEGTQANSDVDEMESLLNIIDKLGVPEEVLKPEIADKTLKKATKTFNPFHVFKALVLNIGNGLTYIVFALLYMFLFGFVFLIYAKITNGENVGLFMKDGVFQVLGLSRNTAGTTEILGGWFIPVMILCIVVLYFAITLLLKLKRTLNTK